MKKILLVLFFSISICFISEAKGKPYPLRDVVECNVRGGLPNFLSRLKDGKDTTIVYLGGSITAQTGWRIWSLDYFKEQFPKVKIEGVNAAIGATGSELGAFRMENDVLKYKPDLLFVEFAVNDAGKDPARLIRAMEGIVRKTWKAFPLADICFVYTLTFRQLKEIQGGKYSRSATVMEEIADKYNIPTIHMALESARLEKAGKLIFKGKNAKVTHVAGKILNEGSGKTANGKIVFSKDGAHPYPDTGHKLYTEAIIRSMAKIEKAGKPGPHELPVPMRADNLENTNAYSVSKATMSSGWRKLDPAKDKVAKHFSRRFSELWVAEQPGETLTFRFKGTKVSIYDIIGPKACRLSVKIDGKKPTVRKRFGNNNRVNCLGIADNLPDKEHTVTIETQACVDKDKIIAKRYKADFDKNPDKYKGSCWHVSQIFIVGELIE